MMYDEFLEIAGLPETAISYTDYKSIIEPAYNISILNKRDFVKSLDLESLCSAEYVAGIGTIKAATSNNECYYINNQSVYDYCKLKNYEPAWIHDVPALRTSEGVIFPVLEIDSDKFPFTISLEWILKRRS